MTDTYKKYTQIEHVIARPGMYVGDTKCTTGDCWIIEDNKAVLKSCKWNPGIFKIFDEILVNAADEVQRNKAVKCIKVKIENDEISVFNDSGIPIEIHPEYKIYIPELIFANTYMKPIIELFLIDSEIELTIFLTTLFCITSILAASIRLITLWFQTRFCYSLGADLSTQLYKNSLFHHLNLVLAIKNY